MDDLREKVEKVFTDDLAFPYSRFYLGWETNKVFIKVVRTNWLLSATKCRASYRRSKRSCPYGVLCVSLT